MPTLMPPLQWFKCFIVLLCLQTVTLIHGLSNPNPKLVSTPQSQTISRRAWITAATTAIATSTASNVLTPKEANAASFPPPFISEDEMNSGSPERRELLRLISSGSNASVDDIESVISRLDKLDPSAGTGAIVPELDGKWELIYSINAESFTTLLSLPKPIRAKSFQLLGSEAVKTLGEDGRVAQVLQFPFGPSIVLSSGAVPVGGDGTTLEIFPPFRLELAFLGQKVTLVNAGSDSDFRALNARDDDAKAAPRNMYKQRYLETSGKSGDIRISEVVSGDPVVVGTLLIHRRV
eukprot:CAMPEP_0172500350 /NCGR_PEP_ID=MMETSP1066-20121228/137159_1 /TAXON_ID=671091 /ORGANISM="Coscinodiscus wailesii, Strain CCMP2513" /LENGTH=292 /DNA_ID=CAMNT_0013274531 /DNA_START=164 /DNA_END=1042 /DNA_ORIENTATION=+